MDAHSIFDDIPPSLPKELIEILLTGRDFKLERIVSRGHVTEPAQVYDQDWHEWVILLAGQARLWIEGTGELSLEPGNYHLLPAHNRHRVTWTAPHTDTVWLALHFRP